MIPKIIHYCWFGGKPLSKTAQKCILSWKKYLSEYEIREWNETNFDINSCEYVKEAYSARKWAFVTDYVRLYVLVNYGGIYMDTDVEVIKPLDSFLGYIAFSGFQTEHEIPTGIMACEKGYALFDMLLHDYDSRKFINEDGSYDVIHTNVVAITEFCLQRGLILNNTFQVIDGFALFPKDVFCAKDYKTRSITVTENTVTIHHFAGSWTSHDEKLEHSIIDKSRRLHVGIIGYIITAPIRFIRKIRWSLEGKNFYKRLRNFKRHD